VDKFIPRGLLKAVARIGDGLVRISFGKMRGPLSFQEYATSAVKITLDISKAQRDLGYMPLVSWQEGLKEMTQIQSL
jgi:nucleoside-diphosphate-sugar epimerase